MIQIFLSRLLLLSYAYVILLGVVKETQILRFHKNFKLLIFDTFSKKNYKYSWPIF